MATRQGKEGLTGRKMSRRALLKAGAGTAALLAAARLNFPGGAFAQTAGPEVTKAIFGYIALMDASPLVIAKEKGIFAKHGVPDVEVNKQASWGATRDNMVLGGANNGIDGAHAGLDARPRDDRGGAAGRRHGGGALRP